MPAKLYPEKINNLISFFSLLYRGSFLDVQPIGRTSEPTEVAIDIQNRLFPMCV